MSSAASKREPSSFRDPSGFVFKQDGTVYRQVNTVYQKNYELLQSSGVYSALTERGWLITHEVVTTPKPTPPGFAVIKPEQLDFISYPYEWCFSQLKDAALLTLHIQQFCLKHNVTLKDASAYNIQFLKGKPVLIDSLSFEEYTPGTPWVAYKQFCQHFLAPLALMSLVDLRLNSLLKDHIDGIPLDLTSRLLPGSTKLSLGLASHIHLHARSQKQHADPTPGKASTFRLPKERLLGILASLESSVQSLRLPNQTTTWQDYYDNTNYANSARGHKEKLVEQWIAQAKPQRVWDAGANDGSFSRLAHTSDLIIASDIDPHAVEHSYKLVKQNQETTVLPLLIDLTNPSPALGWQNQERAAFLDRVSVDLALCLAFIHHLAIANNVPLSMVAETFQRRCKRLIIEFVPKEDSNTQRLLAAREDVFSEYTESGFEQAFTPYFKTLKKERLPDSHRLMYYMETIG